MSSLKIWGLGLIAMGIMGATGVRDRLTLIQTGIQTQVDTALKVEGIDDITATADGQAVTLSLKDGATPPDARQRLRDAKAVLLGIDNGLPKNYADVDVPEIGPQRVSLSGKGGFLYGPVTKVMVTPVSVTRRSAAAVMTNVDESAAEVVSETLPAATGRVATVLTDESPEPEHKAVAAIDVATDTYGPPPVAVTPSYMQNLPKSKAAKTLETESKPDYHGDDLDSRS